MSKAGPIDHQELGTFCPPLRSKTPHFHASKPIETAGVDRCQLYQIQ